MKIESEFRRELKNLLFDRAHPIFQELGIRKVSHQRDWTREYREERIQRLWNIALRILLPQAEKELKIYIHSRKLKNIRGRKQERGQRLYSWAKDNFPKGPILYMFWKKDKCIYVGTADSNRRINDYKKSKYMDRSEADSLEIYSILGKSNRARVECLACHIYQPKENIKKPGKPKYSKKCYICYKRKGIHSSLHALLD
jgi:predicted GIY-YIG superfamily endonuclease